MPTDTPNRTKKRNAYAAVAVDPDTGYCTPGAFELERLFWHGAAKFTHVNEVWPNLYIGDEKTALDRYGLEKSGFTHILNAAHGRWNVDTGTEYYSDMTLEYYGVEAEDLPGFNLSQYFYPAAEFVHNALKNPDKDGTIRWLLSRHTEGLAEQIVPSVLLKILYLPACASFQRYRTKLHRALWTSRDNTGVAAGKVLVHCAMGRSRSASLVLAYLMIYKNMTVVDAITQVLKHRCILPNRGFLKQLRELDIQLALKRREARAQVNGTEKED